MSTEGDDKLDKELDAKFDCLETGEFPVHHNTSNDSNVPSAQKELEANVTELQTRLSLTEESYAVAIKERDAADEARKKLERTLAEFLTRFASVRETQSAAFKEVEKLGDARRDLEKKLASMSAELAATQEARTAALRSRDEALAELEKTKVQLTKFQETAVASLAPLNQEHSRNMKKLMEEGDGVIDEVMRIREENSRQMEKLAALAAELKSHIGSTRRQMGEQLSGVIGTPAEISGSRDAISGSNASVVSGPNGNGNSQGRAMAALAGHAV